MSDSLAVLLKRRLAGDATAKIFIFPMVSKATGGVAPIGWVSPQQFSLIKRSMIMKWFGLLRDILMRCIQQVIQNYLNAPVHVR